MKTRFKTAFKHVIIAILSTEIFFYVLRNLGFISMFIAPKNIGKILALLLFNLQMIEL